MALRFRVSLAWTAGLLWAGCPGCGGNASSLPADDGSTGGDAAQGDAPSTVSLTEYRASGVDKVDLLFVIDNSPSMAEKQEALAAAVPELVGRLVNPRCVSTLPGNLGEALPSSQQPQSPGEACPANSTREFDPVRDIHLGVISTSLGGHGADSCACSKKGALVDCSQASAGWNEQQWDMSHLLTRGPNGTFVNTGSHEFLWWDPDAKNGGITDQAELVSKFTDIVRGAGEVGCGFEAPLEAWYRFLVDPAPYIKMVPVPCNSSDTSNMCRGPEGVDNVVLQQRADFLRPYSLVSVVMLTDENDCSVIDSGQNYLALQAQNGNAPFHLASGTSDCYDNPNGPTCQSCYVGGAGDPACAAGLNDLTDNLNVRCYRQKQRFGIDFLWPIQRYVNALTKQKFEAGDIDKANPGFSAGDINPLFCTDYAVQGDKTKCAHALRDPSLVMLAGIIGVPWQDIARDPNDLKKGYRTTAEFSWTMSQFQANGDAAPGGVTDTVTIWDHILGKLNADGSIDFSPAAEPLDPLMVEAISPRSGTNPATGAFIAAPSAPTPTDNPINGHEYNISAQDDLQYACTFKLSTPKTCATGEACDCATASGMNKPICQDDTGAYGTTQYRAKAYPAEGSSLYSTACLLHRRLSHRSAPRISPMPAPTTTPIGLQSTPLPAESGWGSTRFAGTPR